ncbi:DUF2235 domain-containing protein [Mesorhizobium sp. M1423]|uniref:T6SS phospholipase effector Tle1-like catalytic domain-containing protein n=1 Tax=Mesorhizobium sp. M1423 TaxID=2957101 RepID=UPI0033391329
MATGWGLDQNVKEAYRFLVENYGSGHRKSEEQGKRDRIYTFGFSRGAYSARVLAGFHPCSRPYRQAQPQSPELCVPGLQADR